MDLSRRSSVTIAVLLTAGLLAAPTAAADVADYGLTTYAVDGDTVKVNLDSDATDVPVVVRNAGIQTMELGQCHAAEAAASMKAMTVGKVVRLSAGSADSTNNGRLLRFVDVPATSTTPEVDTQLRQIELGHALWYPLAPEQGRAASYHLAMAKAVLARQNLWNPTHCGVGPSQDANLKFYVNYDADGNEAANLNGEWVRVLNQGTTTVDLSGWWIRSSNPDSHFLPAGTTVAPGKTLTLSVGTGTDTANWKHWGYSGARMQNIDFPGAVGGSFYLYDPQGDVRAHMDYPCMYQCSAQASGKITMTVQPDAPGDDYLNVNGETITIETTQPSVDLSTRVLQVGGNTRDLGLGTVISPGRPLVVHVGQGSSTTLNKYWGRTLPMLPNTGGSVLLRSANAITIACTRWGTGGPTC